MQINAYCLISVRDKRHSFLPANRLLWFECFVSQTDHAKTA